MNTMQKGKFGLDLFREEFPISWYPVAHSSDLKRGQAKDARIGGLELVVFRTEGGNVHALDRHCPHMGASLVMGRVEGECIRCPFHKWSYAGDGKCNDIPYVGKAPIPAQARVGSYPVVERFGTIFVYNEQGAPAFELASFPELDDSDFGFQFAQIPIPIHQLAFHENGLDHMHVRYLHNVDASECFGGVEDETPEGFYFDFTLRNAEYFKVGSWSARGESRTRSRYVGPNLNYGQLFHNSKVVARWVLATQPLSGSESLVYATWSFRRLPFVLRALEPAYLLAMGKLFNKAVTDDVKLSWNDMRPDKRRAWVADDRGLRTLHNYYRSFLPSERAKAKPASYIAGDTTESGERDVHAVRG